ncbi:MAG: lactonase family protein [Clostridiales bacterium]|nr:lactonase family protein [Clostridiales bacterium]
MRLFVGTYTGLGGPGAAVLSLEGDALSILSTDGSLRDPSYLALSKSGDRLYAVGESGASGSAAAFRVSGDRLTPLGAVSTGAQAPCHLCLSADERHLYAANYVTGCVTVFPVLPGGLGERIQMVQHTGSGPNAARQRGPHAHWVGFRPGTEELYAVDLGIDQVVGYLRDPDTGLLSPLNRLTVPGGLGPRHLAFSADGQYGYLAHEMGNAVSAVRFGDGEPRLLDTYPTLPGAFDGESTCAAIRLSPDGKALYVSNRGHDSVAAFEVAEGRLTPAGHIMAFGRTPRDFMPLPGGNMLIAHQDSGTIALVRMRDNALISECAILGAVCLCAG